ARRAAMVAGKADRARFHPRPPCAQQRGQALHFGHGRQYGRAGGIGSPREYVAWSGSWTTGRVWAMSAVTRSTGIDRVLDEFAGHFVSSLRAPVLHHPRERGLVAET